MTIVRNRNFLELLGDKWMPSKRSHDYLKHYWTHFRDIRYQVRNVCEIGVQTEKSVKMWEEFFPNATIHGFDIDPACKSFESDRIKIFIGDQSDQNSLMEFVSSVGELDIVIDDGSHIPAHQIMIFNALFPILPHNGIYVIEDTGGCVGDYELVTVNTLKSLIDNIFYWPNDFPASRWTELCQFAQNDGYLLKHVVGISFYRWISFIFKGDNPGDNPYLTR
jgi:hypothetical protein